MGEFLSRNGYIGQNVGDIIGYHRNFSQATWFCRRLDEGINCLNTPAQLDPKESCPTVFEVGHCWHETRQGATLTTACPNLSPMGQASNNQTSRACYRQEIQNGTVYPAGWMSAMETFEQYVFPDCGMADLEDYSSESDYYSESSEYSSYDSYASSLSDYDLPPGGALPPSESALSTNLHEHIILSILSFITTLVSLLLMVFFLRKCTRIYIHMNLLAAFMLRSLIFLWGQVILGIWHEPKYHYIAKLTQDLLQYQNNLFQVQNLTHMREHYEEHCVQHLENERRFIFLCRLYPCLQHYVVIVCFSWLACEGLYLVLLQQRPAVLFERVKPLRWFVAVSWLLPGLIVAIWALMMLQRPNGEFSCFDTDKYIIWIVEAPIQIFILICFIIFCVLMRDIIRKLRAPNIGVSGNFSWRMSKATLSLIPLLGIQYLLVPYLTEEYGVSERIVRIVTPITISITASHGIVVSFLYCFTSSEMKEAIFRRWRLHRELQGVYNEISSRRQSRDSNSKSTGFSGLINRITNRRGSALSRRQDANSLKSENSRADQELALVPVLPVFSHVSEKRHSAFSKHSDDSLESNGYHSGKSEHEELLGNVDHILDHANHEIPIPTTEFVEIAKLQTCEPENSQKELPIIHATNQI